MWKSFDNHLIEILVLYKDVLKEEIMKKVLLKAMGVVVAVIVAFYLVILITAWL